MDKIYEAYINVLTEGGSPTHKLSLEVLEGKLKGNTDKFTYVRSGDNIKNYKVGDTIKVNVENKRDGKGVKCKITKITREK